ncbi:LacI family DNA-binding transcriptional regulator [Gracilibacillus salitolerans]|uniref:Catabolite control protein A n=1 Tax=Gracilibacillus salitolerans TaxID=2663022 RepID=A0A5Q2TJQ0_9BACI|nr:LacI family DNA-binding transcriptional regulator [Gracilibacillus salitolerans]QGH33568.1 LacI family DNA-binding transcriptional regulator [Gracilibacillus salitolerans]
MVTIYDIAKLANVSPMTVSRVINNTGNTSEAIREKVNKAIDELEYIPNSSARSLTLKESKLLTLLISDIANPFFTKLARGAEDKARELGYQLMLCNTDENIEKEKEYINVIISTGADGVLFSPANNSSSKHIKLFNKHKIPFVLVDRDIPKTKVDKVLGDNYAGTKLLLNHLFECGHKRIALINGPNNVFTAIARKEAYKEVHQLLGLTVNEELMYELHYNRNNDAEHIVMKLLNLPKNKRPTALFASNNSIAIDMVKALHALNINVPDEISVVCFDDLDPNSAINPFLTVVMQPAYDFGYIGTQLLIDRIKNNSSSNKHREVILKPEFLLRDSTKSIVDR